MILLIVFKHVLRAIDVYDYLKPVGTNRRKPTVLSLDLLKHQKNTFLAKNPKTPLKKGRLKKAKPGLGDVRSAQLSDFA